MPSSPPSPAAPGVEPSLMPDIRVPAGWTLAGLAGGLALGIALPGPIAARVAAVAGPVGNLWLRGLQMTILPLVVALLVVGVVQMVLAARAGAMARLTLGLFASVLVSGAVMSALLTPLLLSIFPVPAAAAHALAGAMDTGSATQLPGVAAFLQSLVPVNIIASASEDAMLPLAVFFALFGVALTRLPETHRRSVVTLLEAVAGAVMVMIGWVLALAPIGVFALSLAVAAKAGGGAIGLLAHYITVVSAVGTVVFVAAYALAATAGRVSLLGFARALLPVEAVALSTQSSLASLPAMLVALRRLGVREAHIEFVMPLAMALFRATGPAMNLAVAIYVAKMAGVALTPTVLAAGVAVASLTTLGAVSLPGALSYVSSIGPICLAMGAPVGPLALLVAVEMLPDLMRTLGNVAMDVAVTRVIDARVTRQDV